MHPNIWVFIQTESNLRDFSGAHITNCNILFAAFCTDIGTRIGYRCPLWRKTHTRCDDYSMAGERMKKILYLVQSPQRSQDTTWPVKEYTRRQNLVLKVGITSKASTTWNHNKNLRGKRLNWSDFSLLILFLLSWLLKTSQNRRTADCASLLHMLSHYPPFSLKNLHSCMKRVRAAACSKHNGTPG